jgi:hypothetical protein
MTLTKMQVVALVRKITGEVIRLPLGHEINGYEITEESVKVVISTARVTSARYGLKVTHRGYVGRLWTRDVTGAYVPADPIRMEWKLETPEVWASSARPYIEALASEAWARLCYRPGNSKQPMDGPQGSHPSVR